MKKFFTKSVFLFFLAIFCTWNLNAQETYYTITALANPTELGSVIPSGTASYPIGSPATYIAVHNIGCTFINWTEDGVEVSTDAVYKFTVTCDRTLVANFALNVYTVTATSANPPYCGVIAPVYPVIVPEGETTMIQAVSFLGYTFINWTENGELFSVEPIYHFTVTRDYNLVGHFAPSSYDIVLLSMPEGGGVLSGQGVYEMGMEATVSATPNPNFTFVNWTDSEFGYILSTDTVYKFTVICDRTLVANFAPSTVEITLSKNIEGVGTLHGAGTYSYGQMVAVSAKNYLPEYMFANWTEDGNVIEYPDFITFTATRDRHLVANFVPAFYEIHVYANPYEGGEVTGGGSGNLYGASVTLSATPYDGYQFLNWTRFNYGIGTVVSTDPDYTFEVTEECSYIAYFVEGKKVTVLVNVPGGEVLGGGVYHYGDEVTLEAIPNSGYKFVNWTEGRGELSTDNPYSFIVTEDRVIVANFVEELSIEPIEAGTMMIYPNPTTGELRIDASANSATNGEWRIDNVEIFDIYGRKVYQKTVNQSHVTLQLNELTLGTYILKVYLDQGEPVTWRVVKN